MIVFRDVGLSLGGRVLLEHVDLSLQHGERLALVGSNGSGKTSLLRALTGDLSLDAGQIEHHYADVVRLSQVLPQSALVAWQYLLAADQRLQQALARVQALEAGIAQSGTHGQAPAETHAQSNARGEALAAAHLALSDAGHHDAAARAQALLSGLGFTREQIDTPVNQLSGGWKMRVALATALFLPSQLLLLDEPTNHLDLDAVLWLERWIQRYTGTLIIVSHDRDFLDNVAKATLHIDHQHLVRYSGGYTSFERTRRQRIALQEKQNQKVLAQSQHLQAFINRFRAQATKARQVQSRLKALEKLSMSPLLRDEQSLNLQLDSAGELPNPVLRAGPGSAGYHAEAPVLHWDKLMIERGERIGILGRNGAGKTTLIRTLIGELPALSGDIHRSPSVRLAYFAQQAVEDLRAEESPLQHLQRKLPLEREVILRSYLGRFGFPAERCLQACGTMSGGERARVVLALILWDKPQFLILDEPTNHLDAQARDELAQALAQFDGCLLIVSHDRFLLRHCVDRFWLVRQGQIEAFEGDLEDYARLLTKGALDPVLAVSSRPAAAAPAQNLKEQRRLAAQLREQRAVHLKPVETRLRQAEEGLQGCETELARIERDLLDPLLYQNRERATQLARDRAALQRERERLEDDWLRLSEQRDRLLAEWAQQGEVPERH